jgi:hypothetical protein
VYVVSICLTRMCICQDISSYEYMLMSDFMVCVRFWQSFLTCHFQFRLFFVTFKTVFFAALIFVNRNKVACFLAFEEGLQFLTFDVQLMIPSSTSIQE